MKVKYADQTAYSTVTLTNAGAGHEYDSLEDDFPSLEASDAFLIKNVVLNLDVESADLKESAA